MLTTVLLFSRFGARAALRVCRSSTDASSTAHRPAATSLGGVVLSAADEDYATRGTAGAARDGDCAAIHHLPGGRPSVLSRCDAVDAGTLSGRVASIRIAMLDPETRSYSILDPRSLDALAGSGLAGEDAASSPSASPRAGAAAAADRAKHGTALYVSASPRTAAAARAGAGASAWPPPRALADLEAPPHPRTHHPLLGTRAAVTHAAAHAAAPPLAAHRHGSEAAAGEKAAAGGAFARGEQRRALATRAGVPPPPPLRAAAARGIAVYSISRWPTPEPPSSDRTSPPALPRWCSESIGDDASALPPVAPRHTLPAAGADDVGPRAPPALLSAEALGGAHGDLGIIDPRSIAYAYASPLHCSQHAGSLGQQQLALQLQPLPLSPPRSPAARRSDARAPDQPQQQPPQPPQPWRWLKSLLPDAEEPQWELEWPPRAAGQRDVAGEGAAPPPRASTPATAPLLRAAAVSQLAQPPPDALAVVAVLAAGGRRAPAPADLEDDEPAASPPRQPAPAAAGAVVEAQPRARTLRPHAVLDDDEEQPPPRRGAQDVTGARRSGGSSGGVAGSGGSDSARFAFGATDELDSEARARAQQQRFVHGCTAAGVGCEDILPRRFRYGRLLGGGSGAHALEEEPVQQQPYAHPQPLPPSLPLQVRLPQLALFCGW